MFYVLTDLADFTTLIMSYKNLDAAIELARKIVVTTGLTCYVIHSTEGERSLGILKG